MKGTWILDDDILFAEKDINGVLYAYRSVRPLSERFKQMSLQQKDKALQDNPETHTADEALQPNPETDTAPSVLEETTSEETL